MLFRGLLITVYRSRPWVVSVEPERPTPRREFFAEPRFTPEQWAQRVAAFEQGLMTAETLVRSSGVLLPSDPPAN